MKIFYTYAWSREDGTPYYIGKSFRGRNGNRAYRKGCPPRERIAVQEWPDESTAFAYEVYQIDFGGEKITILEYSAIVPMVGKAYAEHPEQRQKVSTMLIGNTYRRGSMEALF